MKVPLLGATAFWLVLMVPAGAAQTPAAPDQHQPTSETQDIVDLIRKWRKRDVDPDASPPATMRAIAPVIGVRPSSGVQFGVAGNVAFHSGDPRTTHISSGVGSVTVSTKSQTSVTARVTMFGRDDRFRLEVDDRFQWTSQETFGLGLPTPLEDGLLAEFDFFRLHHSVYKQLRANLFAGGGLHFDRHANVEPGEGAEAGWPASPYVAYSAANGLPLDTQTSAGPSVEIIWDSRDSVIDAGRGWMARASYRWLIDRFLGGDSGWEKVNLDARTYLPLTESRRHKLAAWVFADLVVDGLAPYFDLPATGNDAYGRSGRGYAEGHFRGERLAFVELEYRGTLLRNRLLGMVAFVNATTVADRPAGQRLFDRVAPGGGAGLRLLINKRSGTNLAFDLGFGEKGNRGVYLAVQEAF